jgi:hypothetical protein
MTRRDVKGLRYEVNGRVLETKLFGALEPETNKRERVLQSFWTLRREKQPLWILGKEKRRRRGRAIERKTQKPLSDAWEEKERRRNLGVALAVIGRWGKDGDDGESRPWEPA